MRTTHGAVRTMSLTCVVPLLMAGCTLPSDSSDVRGVEWALSGGTPDIGASFLEQARRDAVAELSAGCRATLITPRLMLTACTAWEKTH